MASLAATRAAQKSLSQHLQRPPWLRGIGITQSRCMGPDPYALQVNVAALADAQRLPKVWLGVPVTVSVVGNIVALGASAESNDIGNVVAGALIAASTFFVGKIAVESIIAHRKETFSRKGKPKAAVKAKETTLDGIVKVAGIGFGLWRMTQDLPALYDEIKKLNIP